MWILEGDPVSYLNTEAEIFNKSDELITPVERI